jgi:hypothetical protein
MTIRKLPFPKFRLIHNADKHRHGAALSQDLTPPADLPPDSEPRSAYLQPRRSTLDILQRRCA